ncbi:RsiV family protein [Natranaerobius trueperi]|uniref:Anti-sigma factor n=1 Tax=Natranaerobius trueperi TaxID=759412 RepID=A0A226C1G9_9FIRM|nr:RsiV family protein [Natranaerobius trueperi]OWZ85031.1 anti-sigma factor [Natranaerobius trueperi]
MKKIKDLQKEYQNIEIPDELELETKKNIKEAKKQSGYKVQKKLLVGTAVASLLVFSAVNINSNVAKAFSDVPVIGNIVQVITFEDYQYDDDKYQADIETPGVEGFEDETLQDTLNEKYIEESNKLYQEFLAQIDKLEEVEDGHLAVDAGYEVLNEDDQLLTIKRYTTNTIGSSSTQIKYDTIDKENEVLITLPSLFENDDYVKVISDYIKKDMSQQMKEDDNIIYWVDENEPETFTQIEPDQSFYISENNKLVISFNDYEVAPGYMGVVEFEIPTDIISDILVSDKYLN